jgi:protein TonB
MFATFGFNAAILAALIAIPLFHPTLLPQMLPQMVCCIAPEPVKETKPVVQPQHQTTQISEMSNDSVVAPPRIPTRTWIPAPGDDPGPVNVGTLDPSGTGIGSADNPFGGHHVPPVMHTVVQAKPHISLGVMEGMLIYRVLPVYPAMARAIHVAGTVHLQASISRDGAIENLHVLDGPPLLQQAAIDAVKQWRYRPYLLNGEPVEVETTINVEFTLN